MRSLLLFFGSFFSTALIYILIVIHFAPITTIPKVKLPSFSEVFISSYGAHFPVHRIIYHGLFDFAKRMAEADVLIIGNSHAEMGLSAERIAQVLSLQTGKPIKVLNLGIGYGESFAFQKKCIEHNNLKDKLILLEIFATLSNDVSQIGKQALTESKLTAYAKVFETWVVVLRDWLFDGVLPRFSFIDNRFIKERFLCYPIGFRKWKNGDVFDYWFPNYGNAYSNTPSSLISFPQVQTSFASADIEKIRKNLDLKFLQARNLRIITTLIPSNDLNGNYYVTPIKKIGLSYIDIPFAGVELYDKAHANANGRLFATNQLLLKLKNDPSLLRKW